MNKVFDKFFSSDSSRDNKKKSNDIIAKILCFLFAVVLWLLVIGQATDLEQEKTYYAVPVTVSGANILLEENGLSIVSTPDYITNITVRGSRANLSKFSSEDIVASYDVGSLKTAGEHSLKVKVSCPPSSGFYVVGQSLESVSITVDKVTSKTLDIDVKIVNAEYDSSKFALGTPTVYPQTVTLTGPQMLLDTIETAVVELELGKVTSNIGYNRRIMLLDHNGEEVDSPYLSISNVYADGEVPFISVEEASKIHEKTIDLSYAFKHGHYSKNNCEVEIYPSQITVKGKDSVLSKIDEIIVITIDESEIYDSTVLEVPIELPYGVTFTDNSQKSATVSIFLKQKFAQNTVELSDINFMGEKIAHLNGSYEITFIGDEDELSLLVSDETSFSASVDISNITRTGTYKLPVIVTISDTYKNVWCKNGYVYVSVE